MIPQHTPLYATVSGKAYVVVGWQQPYATSYALLPILAPLGHQGPVIPLATTLHATYSATPPIPDRVGGPDVADTAVIPAYRR